MELSTLYWVLILPNIGTFFTVIGIALIGACFAVIVSAAITIDCTYHDDEKKNRLRKTRNKAATFSFIPAAFFLIATFVPSSQQMMYLIGGYVATNVENIEKLPKNVVNAANKFLEQYSEKKEK